MVKKGDKCLNSIYEEEEVEDSEERHQVASHLAKLVCEVIRELLLLISKEKYFMACQRGDTALDNFSIYHQRLLPLSLIFSSLLQRRFFLSFVA